MNETKKNLLGETLGNIVSEYPLTVAVMNTYKLDYCCGGKDTLKKAIDELSLKEESVVSDLIEVIERQKAEGTAVKKWEEESIATLIDYILSKHHTFMKDTLDELNELVYKILKVHFATDGETLLKLHHLFGTLKTELEAHLIKEEERLFPQLIAYGENPLEAQRIEILNFIESTEDEHDAAGDLFKQIASLTNDYQAPEDACFSYKRTYELLDALEKDTFNHIHLENSVLFMRLQV